MNKQSQDTNVNEKTDKDNKEELIIIEDSKQIVKKEETNLVKAETTEFDALIKIAEAYDKLKPFADNYIKNNPNSGLKTAEDVFTTMVLGRELGLNPVTALKLGNTLNKEAIVSIWKGKALGIDPITSMENIHVFETKNGIKTFTGYHIFIDRLNFFGIKIEKIRDNEPLYQYQDYNDIIMAKDEKGKTVNVKIYLEEHIIQSDRFFIVTKENKDSIPVDKIAILQTNVIYTYGTILKFIKEVPKTNANPEGLVIHYESFTEADAIKAGYNTRDSYKQNTKVMYLSKCIGRGGRMIGGEFMKGIYTNEEIEDFSTNTNK